MTDPIDLQSRKQLFLDARSRNGWSDAPVSDETLRALYDLVKYCPTSMNTSPARFLFIRSDAAKARLMPHLAEGNRAKSQAAPCVVIIGHDTEFYEKMPELFPARPQIRDMMAGNSALAEATGYRNGTLQGGYLILAARALGLDCGPMSGFDAAGVDGEFFAGTTVRSNFLCALGTANDAPFPRLPRLDFADACTLL